MKNSGSLKTPLRYPGGKSRAINFLCQHFPERISSYREPFVGGGSVFIAKDITKYNWINDLDSDLYSFYKIISSSLQRKRLIDKLLKTKITKKLHNNLFYSKPKKQFDKAYRYYVLNNVLN